MRDDPSAHPFQTADSADRRNPVELTFRSPTLNETFGKFAFLIVIILLVIPIFLVTGMSILAGYDSSVLGATIFTGIVLVSLGGLLFSRKGRIVLQADKLIEYNCFNSARIFSYAQICEVKQGTHSDEVWIRYYPVDKNGQINYRAIRETNLLPVYRVEELCRALSQRIRAPQPALQQGARSLWLVLLVGILVIPPVLFLFIWLVTLIPR